MSEEPAEYRVTKKRRLNGWQRLWVVVAVPSILTGVYPLLFAKKLTGDDEVIIGYLILGPFALYVAVVLGRKIARWVIAGFRTE